MTIDAWLTENVYRLNHAGIETSRLDCLVLLSDEIGRDKSWLLAHPEYELQIEQVNLLSTNITQRAQHTPLAYIRGKCEFYGREFMVNADVLVPRPESEDIIELLKQVINIDVSSTIYDVGTGSGILAITAKLELPHSTVIATDIDAACLKIAKNNASSLRADVTFLQGDLLMPILQQLQDSTDTPVIMANLPYVPTGYPVNLAAAHEPKLALYSGNNGLDHYSRFFAQLDKLPNISAQVITESLASQHASLVKVAQEHRFNFQTSCGLVQLFTRIT